MAAPHTTSRDVAAELKWLRLVRMHWADAQGVDREWEYVERTTATVGDGVGHVEMCCMKEGDGEPKVLLVTQFRPPVEQPSVEWPAGLVEAGETPAAAALRELKEETGYVGRVLSVSAPCSNDPGMSNSKMSFVRVAVDMSDPRNQAPEPQQEEEEDIRSEWVPLHGLHAHLDACAARGENVDGKVYTFAVGVATAAMLQPGGKP